jgi:dinuclear metal center protein, YbgI/SA1388 family
MLVKELVHMIDVVAPFSTAEEYDNVGLLVGDENAQITGIMLALDVTEAVLMEMRELGLNVLITHHPLMFSPINRLLETEHEGGLIAQILRQNAHLIVAHTNLDIAAGGTNDALVQLFGLQNPCGKGYLRVGKLALPMAADALQAFLKEKLNAPVMLMGDAKKEIHTLGLCSGGASDEWAAAYAAGADAFLTGEVKHYHALEATARGMVLFQGGHFATENPGMAFLALALQNALDKVKCNVAVYRTKSESYPVQ